MRKLFLLKQIVKTLNRVSETYTLHKIKKLKFDWLFLCYPKSNMFFSKFHIFCLTNSFGTILIHKTISWLSQHPWNPPQNLITHSLDQRQNLLFFFIFIIKLSVILWNVEGIAGITKISEGLHQFQYLELNYLCITIVIILQIYIIYMI